MRPPRGRLRPRARTETLGTALRSDAFDLDEAVGRTKGSTQPDLSKLRNDVIDRLRRVDLVRAGSAQ